MHKKRTLVHRPVSQGRGGISLFLGVRPDPASIPDQAYIVPLHAIAGESAIFFILGSLSSISHPCPDCISLFRKAY